MIDFKNTHSLDHRKEEYDRVHKKYPLKIPIILQSHDKITIDKNKFLLPKDITFGHFMCIVRERVNLDSNEAIFFFINNKLQPSSILISNIYDREKDIDGFLYVYISKENTFG